ncbi:MAG TPA: N-6 DNA methylase [Blastocatellia bacterium]|nr:N-6 DNA methylase [Blastocatellia bacterium]
MNFIGQESSSKLRGAYYTDLDIAAFLARWALQTRPKRVLEPSCGDGAFIAAIAQSDYSSLRDLVAFEIDPKEAAKARLRARIIGPRRVRVLTQNFLEWSISNDDTSKQFDAVLGNPPFIRYQYLDDIDQQRMRKIFDGLALPFTGHTNAWVPFVLLAIDCLKPEGRLAMVVPAEILHVLYAEPLRRFISINCSRALIIDTQELWFSDALQGVVLMLAEKRSPDANAQPGIAIASVASREFLNQDPEALFEHARFTNADDLKGKWTRALLTDRERSLLDAVARHPAVSRFQQIASVDVGIVTGANKFFLVPDKTVSTYGLEPWACPMFGRSSHARGVIYDVRSHDENRKGGLATNFLWFKQAEASNLPDGVRRYIRLGEAEGLHRRYKCRIREPWYNVPSVSSAPVAMLKRCHFYPRLILNRLGALTTDTAYRVRPIAVDPARLVCSFVNSLTALTAELEGRHYGGGVLELVPSEIERLLVPVASAPDSLLEKLDRAVRAGEPPESLLPRQDRLLLRALGLSPVERESLFLTWDRLRRRRLRASTRDMRPR